MSAVQSVVMLKYLYDWVYDEGNHFIGAQYIHIGIQYTGVKRERSIFPCGHKYTLQDSPGQQPISPCTGDRARRGILSK
jgi:hypothetical protein